MKKFFLILSVLVVAGTRVCAMDESAQLLLPVAEYQLQLSSIMQLGHLYHDDYLVGELFGYTKRIMRCHSRLGLSEVARCVHEIKSEPDRARYDFAAAVDILVQLALARLVGCCYAGLENYDCVEELPCVEKAAFDAAVRAANIDVGQLIAQIAVDFSNEISRAFSPISPRSPTSPSSRAVCSPTSPSSATSPRPSLASPR